MKSKKKTPILAKINRDTFVLMFVVVLIIFVSILIYNKVLLNSGPFLWDEAHHSIFALITYQDLIQLDVFSFLKGSYSQVYWPFLYSWILDFSFLIFGTSIVTARITSLVCFFFFVLIVYKVGEEMSDEKGWLIGVIAVLFPLTSNGLTLYAAQAMLEIPGILLLSLTFLFYIRASKNRNMRDFFLTGCCAALTYFLKTGYGISIIITLFICRVIECKFEIRKLFSSNNLYIFLPIALSLLIWFADTSKIFETISALSNRTQGPARFSLEGILFHPKRIWEISGSTGIFILFVLSFIISFKEINNPRTQILLIFGLTVLTLHTLSQTKDAKHIIKIMPILYILSGYKLVQLFDLIKRKFRSRFLELSIIGVVVVIMAFQFSYFFSQLRPFGERRIYNVLEFMKAEIKEGDRVLVIGEFQELSSHLIDWSLAVEPDTNSKQHMQPLGNGAVKFIPINEKNLSFNTVKNVVDLKDTSHKGNPINVVHPHINYSIKNYNTFDYQKDLEDMIKRYSFSSIFIIKVKDDSKYYNDDYVNFDKWTLLYAPFIENRNDYEMAKSREFQGTGITVHMYRKII